MSRDMMLRGQSDRHLHADHAFYFLNRDHLDRVPRTTVEEGAVRPFAHALLTADAEHGIHFDAAEGQMIFVGHPVHAIGHGTVRHARGRTGATGTAFGDDSKFLGPFLARSSDPLGLRLHLDDGRLHAKDYDTSGAARVSKRFPENVSERLLAIQLGG